MNTQTQNIAETILAQLGGRRFIAMTGSKNFIADKNKLRIDLPKNNAGVNKLVITLEADDTYSMNFFNTRPLAKTPPKEQRFTGVYADMLQDIFTTVTGLYTRF